jgi:hypothetical protein
MRFSSRVYGVLAASQLLSHQDRRQQMKRLIPILFLVVPLAAFAQSPMAPKARETDLLKGFGLNDSQIAQVFDIQDKTRATIKRDAVQLRLLHAQMDKALLPTTLNMQEVNGYIAQMAQTQADLMKTFVGARVQLRQLIGEDNFPAYARFVMDRFGFHHPRFLMHRPTGSGAMNGFGPRTSDTPSGENLEGED